jgi:predicted AAA+ superfamily ATPase
MREAGEFKQQEINFYPERLIFYRNINNDPLIVMTKELINNLINHEDENRDPEGIFFQICGELVQKAESYQWQGNLWKHYLSLLMAQAENTFSRSCARLVGDNLDTGLFEFALHDLKLLKKMWDFDFKDLGEVVPLEIADTLKNFICDFSCLNPRGKFWYGENVGNLCNDLEKAGSPEQMVECLKNFYRDKGYGKIGMFYFFSWGKEGLRGISYPDPVTLEDLIGYEEQKEIIVKNTEAFTRGKKANNMLLYGERGTGKSSTVKALVNEYHSRGLRMVEVHKAQLAALKDIMGGLREYPQRFIVFIDDLSFESNETEYKYLKYILEGGVEVIPENVVIYATSNRRHLVRESWQDRDEGTEVRVSDSLSEKLSLADRFGITVTFTSPDQEEYLKIVEGLAEKSKLEISKAELREKALWWERWHNGRSGRTAKQFINSLLSEL